MLLEKFSLAGQVGIVTGGGQGLGKVFCRAFAEAGADLVVADLVRVPVSSGVGRQASRDRPDEEEPAADGVGRDG